MNVKWKFSLLLVCLLVSNGYPLTLTDLLARSRVFLRDTSPDTTLQKFSDTQLTRFLNDGQKEVNLQTWAVIASTRFQLSAGTTEYSLPSTYILPLRMTFNNSPIVERTFSFLDESQSDWINTSGIPDSYYIRTDSAVVSGVTRECVGLIPVTTFTAVAELQFLAAPTDLATGSDVPFGSDNNRLYGFHQVLAYFAAYRGFLSMGLIDSAAIYYQEYTKLVTAMESSLKSRLNFNPSYRGQLPRPVQTQQQ